MGAEVRKSSPAVIIRPPEPQTTTTTKSGTIKLTCFDRGYVKVPTTVLLVFEHMVHDAIDSIKAALSQALVHYYPFAGRIISSGAVDDHEFSICCTGDGVELLTASMDCSLKEAKIFDASSGRKINSLLDELAVFYPAGSFGLDDPMLSVQVTEFSCGGLVLGVTWNHGTTDGFGIAHFLAAIGELACGSPSPSVVPVRCDDAVSRVQSWPSPLWHAMLVCPESQGMELIVPLDISIPLTSINRVKAEYHSCFGGQPCTVFEVVLAVLWRCRTRATMSNNPGNPVYLACATNMRKYVGAKDGYYGNCAADQLLAMATRSAVAEAGLVDLIKMIKRGKDQLHDKVKMDQNGSSNDDQLLPDKVKMENGSSNDDQLLPDKVKMENGSSNDDQLLPDKVKMENGSSNDDQLPDKEKMGNGSNNDDQLPDNVEQLMRGLCERYDIFSVSSWRNIGFEQVDFGSGAPVRVMFHMPGPTPELPSCIMLPSCKGMDRVNLLLLGVKEEHVDAFLEELAKQT